VDLAPAGRCDAASRRAAFPEAWAVVVAAGSGVRFGLRKQHADLAGRSVLTRSVDAALAACGGVVVVVPADEAPGAGASTGVDPAVDAVVAGGVTRSASVRAGLAAVPPAAEVIAVHDAARPLAAPEVWGRVLGAVLDGADGAIPVVAVTDTIKQVDAVGALRTLDRSSLVAVQTPQAFRAAILRRAHAGGDEATDDAALVEALGGRVVAVDGRTDNLKITTPADLHVAAALLRQGEVPRAGAS
jgi:2-C-methyl-D-erythritol 4-phosphate cytidylyltransferase